MRHLHLRIALLALAGYLLWPLAPVLHAAITVTEVITQGDTTNSTTYITAATYDPPAGALLLCVTHHTKGTTPDDVPSLTFDGDATTFTSLGAVDCCSIASPTARTEAWVHTFPSDVASGTITTGILAANQTGLAWMCVEVLGANLTAGPGSNGVLQTKTTALDTVTAHTLTLDSARTANSALVHVLGLANARTFTPEYANTGTETTYATPTTEAKLQWVIGGSDTTPLWTTDSNANGGQIAVEIAVSANAAVPSGLNLLGVGSGQ